jgi:transcription initiation factor TFIIH subunit 2
MSDSDDDYVAGDDDSNIIQHQGSSRHGTRSSGPVAADTTQGTTRKKVAWEEIHRSWDTVIEGADGSINNAVEGLREGAMRKR